MRLTHSVGHTSSLVAMHKHLMMCRVYMSGFTIYRLQNQQVSSSCQDDHIILFCSPHIGAKHSMNDVIILICQWQVVISEPAFCVYVRVTLRFNFAGVEFSNVPPPQN